MKDEITSFSLSKAAKLIKFPGGDANFIRWLRQRKYLTGDLKPYAAHINAGWMLNKCRKIPHAKGHKEYIPEPRITIAGLGYFKRKTEADWYFFVK